MELRSGRRLHRIDRIGNGEVDAVREGAGGTDQVSNRAALADQRHRVCQWRPDKNPMTATTPPTATNIPMTARVARMSPSTKETSYNTIHSYRSILGRVKKPFDLRLTSPGPVTPSSWTRSRTVPFHNTSHRRIQPDHQRAATEGVRCAQVLKGLGGRPSGMPALSAGAGGGREPVPGEG